MTENVCLTADKIRSLEVQGARNVAIAAVKAIEAMAHGTKAKNRESFVKELSEAKTVLFAARETEPLMRNAVKWIINRVEDSDERGVEALGALVSSSSRSFQKKLEASIENIAEIGSRRIRDGMVIFTHCHSSTSSHLLGKAREAGKTFEVICTETRPALQGRITAREMVELGIKTTMIVDSAARSFMNVADMVIVGADALTSEGNIINKIGTSNIALLAYEARKPFYVVSELLKFDPNTLCGDYEKIEERSPLEVWTEAPENLIIRNPAFDITRRDYIHGVICEEGVISPHSIVEVMHRRYPWVFH